MLNERPTNWLFTGQFWMVCAYEGLGGFGWCARTRGWVILDGMHSKVLILL